MRQARVMVGVCGWLLWTPLAQAQDAASPPAAPAPDPAPAADSEAPAAVPERPSPAAPAATGEVSRQAARPTTGEVRGRILADGEPVAGATVTRDGTFDGAITEADGAFALAGLPAGRVTLRIDAPGLGSRTQVVAVQAGGVTTFDIAVVEQIAVGEEIVVTGTRSPEKRLDSPVNVELVSHDDIRRAGGASYLASLSRLKGVDYSTSGVTEQQISARGFTTQFNSRMITLLDGRLAQLPGNGLPQAGLLPATPLDMKAIEVVVGPASALYGPNAHTGVINVTTKTPWDESGAALLLRGGNRDLMSGSARVAGTFADRVGWKVNGEYLQANDFLPTREAVVGDDGVSRRAFAYGTDAAGAGVHERDLIDGHDVDGLKADGSLYYKAGEWLAKGSYGGSRSTGFALTNAGRNHIRDWTVNYQSLQLTGPGWFGQITRTGNDAGKSYQLNRLAATVAAMGGVEAFEPAELDALRDSIKFIDRSQMFDAELQHHRRLGPVSATAGLQSRLYLPVSEGTYLSDADEDIQATEVGGYAQLDYEVVPDKLRLIGAGRVDRHSDYATQFSPSANAVYTVAPLHNVRAGYQRAFKSPTILENHLLIGGNLVGNSTGFEIRNAAGDVLSTIDPLAPEEVDSIEVGYKGVVANKVFVDAVVYNSWYTNFISPLSQVANPAAMAPAEATYGFYADGTPVAEGMPTEGVLFTYMNFGKAYARGADLGATFLPVDGVELGAGVSAMELVSFESGNDLQRDLLLNVPTFKLKGSVQISGLGFDDYFVRLSGRFKNGHEFESGYWSSARFGAVPASFVADLAAGYTLVDHGVSIGLTVANLLDNKDPDVLGAPTPRRLAFLQLGYAFDGLRY